MFWNIADIRPIRSVTLYLRQQDQNAVSYIANRGENEILSGLIVSQLHQPFLTGTENIKLHRWYTSVKISINLHPYIDTSWPSLLPNAKMKNKIQLAGASLFLTDWQQHVVLPTCLRRAKLGTHVHLRCCGMSRCTPFIPLQPKLV
jgi:hypothetical protein